MSDDELHYLSGHEALALFRSKQLSPVELMLALIDRAEEVEPKINAFCDRILRRGARTSPRCRR